MTVHFGERLLSKNGANCYVPQVLEQMDRLLSTLDRETHSRTYGSFDRDHWGWKFRDFPLGMLQSAIYPLALLWHIPFPNNPYHNNPRLREWLIAALDRIVARQHINGAFDAFAPNEQNVGTTLGVIHGLTEVLRLGQSFLSPTAAIRHLEAVRKACEFSLQRDEEHGFVSNHRALFAVTFLNASELLEVRRYRERAEELIDSILKRQSSDGWYLEYEGPDPGYESLSISHLSIYWSRTGSAKLLNSLRKCIEFYAHCIHPDGSVGGAYGSRHTSLYYPGGFEILAPEIPIAAAIAKFMRERLDRHNVVTPAVTDAENLPSLAYSYLEACLSSDVEDMALPLLPCQALDGVRYFPDSAIAVSGTSSYYAITNARKGGVCRVFDKRSERVAYEDAGYLVHAGGRTWTSQLINLGNPLDAPNSNEIVAATPLAQVQQQLPTPAKFLLLRLLNLTLFRSLRIGAWLRRLIVTRLITRKRPGPLRLTRSVSFLPDTIVFRDSLGLEKRIHVEDVALPRSFTAIHMGSAKYFHPSELEPTLQAPTEGMAEALNDVGVAELEFSLHFPADSDPAISVGPAKPS